MFNNIYNFGFIFFSVHILAEKTMFPVSISPYLAGVAPLYLSIRDEEGEGKVNKPFSFFSYYEI